MKQRDLIVAYLRSNRTSLDPEDGWVWGYKLQGIDTGKGFIGAAGSRRARELADAWKIERRIKNKMVQYRYPVPAPKPVEPTLQPIHLEEAVQQSMFQN